MAEQREQREREAAERKEAEFDAMYENTQSDEYTVKLEEDEELTEKYDPRDDL